MKRRRGVGDEKGLSWVENKRVGNKKSVLGGINRGWGVPSNLGDWSRLSGAGTRLVVEILAVAQWVYRKCSESGLVLCSKQSETDSHDARDMVFSTVNNSV